MAKLTTKKRKALRASSFALGGRRYPIHDITHARSALQRVSQHGTPSEKKRVRAAVRHKYPSIKVTGNGPTRRGVGRCSKKRR